MNSYYDIIYLMGAMLVFSLLSIQTNRIFLLYDRIQINSEIEYSAISVAQDQIDKIRWMKSESQFHSYKNLFPKEVPVVFEEETLYFKVGLESEEISIPDSNVESIKVTVMVTNEYLKTNNNERFVKFEFMKSF